MKLKSVQSLKGAEIMHYCEECGKYYAEKHHIVFRSQGGLDIEVNYKYLCSEHHRGKDSPHMKKTINEKYKKEMQNKLFEMFGKKDTYQVKEIAEIIGYDRKRLEKKFDKVKNHCGEYAVEDIIRKLMGGKIY